MSPTLCPALKLLLSLASLLVLGCASGPRELPTLEPLKARASRVPVVFVPGVTGSVLSDRQSGEPMWGTGHNLLSPRDGGNSMARPLGLSLGDPTALEATALLDTITVLKIFDKAVYGPIPAMLEQNGYRLGRLDDATTADAATADADLFLFHYDWRDDNIVNAHRLLASLEALAEARGVSDQPLEVDFICQSNGAQICRWLTRYGSATIEQAEAGNARPSPRLRARKMVLIGTSNGGSLRVFRLLNRGRRYVPLIGRMMRPEVMFTFPALFQDLPIYRPSPFVDPRGRALELDLFDADTWVDQGWSIFDDTIRQRADRRPEIYADHDARLAHLSRSLDRARRIQQLLFRDPEPTDRSDWPSADYYMIQNVYHRTPHLAVIGDHGELWFEGDPEVENDRYLRAIAAAPGDGHATVPSQLYLSTPETEAIAADIFGVEGGHFEIILDPGSLRRLLEVLAAPTAGPRK